MKITTSIIIILLSLPLTVVSQDQEAQDLIEKGIHLYRVRSLDSAIYYYNLAIEFDSLADEAYFRRAQVKEKRNDILGANEDYRKAISIDPKPVYYNNIGINKAIEGYHEEAIEEYDRAIALDSTYVHALFNKGISYHHLGMYDEACEYTGIAKEKGFQLADQYYQEYCIKQE